MYLLFYLIGIFFIARASVIPSKTILWMVIALLGTIGVVFGLGLLSFGLGLTNSDPERVAHGLGGLGIIFGMLISIAVGLNHMRSHKRQRPRA